MYAAERQQRIMAEARRAGRVEVASLADSLGVAAETVRRDLTALERRGSAAPRARRRHPRRAPRARAHPRHPHRPPRRRQAPHRRPRPRRAARRGGTRAPRLRLHDPGRRPAAPPDLDLTVVTNSRRRGIAALSTHPGVTLYLLGGRVRGVTGAAVGDWATDALEGVVVDVAVLGTNGYLGDPRPHHPRPGRGAGQGRHGRRRPPRASSPPTRARPATTTSTASPTLAEVDVVVTDTDLADDVAAELRAAGPEVVTA